MRLLNHLKYIPFIFHLQKGIYFKWLISYIRKNGNPGECAFCIKKSKFVIETSSLKEIFLPLTDIYESVDEILSTLEEDAIWTDSPFIYDKIQDKWQIFKYEEDARKIFESIFSEFYNNYPYNFGYPSKYDTHCVSLYRYGDQYEDEKNKWHIFCNEII